MVANIDPEMRYCLRCNDEYEPEIVTCGGCGQALLSGVEVLALRQGGGQRQAKRKGPLTAADSIVTVFKAPLADVKRIERQLQRENIGAMIAGSGPSCGKGCCGGGEMELRVRQEDAPAAMAVIEADFVRQTASHGEHGAVADYGFDPLGHEHSCPACGCVFAPGGQGMTCPDCGLCFG